MEKNFNSSENGHSTLFEFEKAILQKKTEENTKQTRLPEFFKFNITLEWFILFKCTLCEKVFNWFIHIQSFFLYAFVQNIDISPYLSPFKD